jgi:hypothetical protein
MFPATNEYTLGQLSDNFAEIHRAETASYVAHLAGISRPPLARRATMSGSGLGGRGSLSGSGLGGRGSLSGSGGPLLRRASAAGTAISGAISGAIGGASTVFRRGSS